MSQCHVIRDDLRGNTCNSLSFKLSHSYSHITKKYLCVTWQQSLVPWCIRCLVVLNFSLWGSHFAKQPPLSLTYLSFFHVTKNPMWCMRQSMRLLTSTNVPTLSHFHPFFYLFIYLCFLFRAPDCFVHVPWASVTLVQAILKLILHFGLCPSSRLMAVVQSIVYYSIRFKLQVIIYFISI